MPGVHGRVRPFAVGATVAVWILSAMGTTAPNMEDYIWLALLAVLLVALPANLGSRFIVRQRRKSMHSALAFGADLGVGLGIGWLALPLLLFALALGFMK